MFAVIKTGGKQYRVKKGDILEIEKLSQDANAKITFDEVLLVEDKKTTMIGTPLVKSALVKAVVVDNFKGKKVLVFKKKRRKQYKKLRGHRQELTRVRIEEIVVGKKPAAKPAPAEKGKAPEKPKKAAPKAKAQAKPAAKKPQAKDAVKPAAKKPAAKPAAKKTPAKPAPVKKAVTPGKPKKAEPKAKAPAKPAAKKPAAKPAAKKPAAKPATKKTSRTKAKEK